MPPALAAVPRASRAALVRAGRAVADLLFPPVCAACRKAVADPDALCVACWSRLRPLTGRLCPVMGVPLPPDAGPGTLSLEALRRRAPFARARAAVRYGDVAADLVFSLKYRDRPEISRLLAPMMGAAGAELLADKPVLVPVPLHPRRLVQRRFNQSALLAEAIAHHHALAHRPAALRRLRQTPPQVGLSSQERTRNVAGAFEADRRERAAIEGRRVLLVDDVYTSGATARAAARALLRGGAVAVDVLTFARVVRDGEAEPDFADDAFAS